MQQQVTMNHIK